MIIDIPEVKVTVVNVSDKIELPPYSIYVGYNTPSEKLNADLQAKLSELRAIAVIFVDVPVDEIDDYSEVKFMRIDKPYYIGNLDGSREEISNAIVRANVLGDANYTVKPLEELLDE